MKGIPRINEGRFEGGGGRDPAIEPIDGAVPWGLHREI